MYCTDIFYPVAVYEETTLFDTRNENKTQTNISAFALFF